MAADSGFQLASGAPEIYEDVLVPLWFGRWAEALLDLVEIKAGEAVLDIACGTGVTTRLAAAETGVEGDVVGLDINASMLAIAKGLAGNSKIDWIEGDVCKSGQQSGRFDVVISQHGYHYFPDKPGALAEIHRLMTPGGRFAFSIWDGHSAYTSALCAAVEKHISAEVAARQNSQRVTPNAAELADAVETAGFRDVVVHRQTLDIRVPAARTFVPLHLGSMPIAAAFDALSDDDKQRLVDEVETALAHYVQGDELVYPDTVNVAFAFK